MRVTDYIYKCSLHYIRSHDDAAGEPETTDNNDDYDGTTGGGPVSLEAALCSLPETGGGFPVCDYVGPELAAFARAEPAALEDPTIAELAARAVATTWRLRCTAGWSGPLAIVR